MVHTVVSWRRNAMSLRAGFLPFVLADLVTVCVAAGALPGIRG
jgi:hypothetical protein